MGSRLITCAELAEYLGKTEKELVDVLPRMYDLGLPKPTPVLGNYDKKAVDLWLDDMNGLTGNYVIEPRYPSRPFIHPFNRCPPAEPPRNNKNDSQINYTVAQAFDDYLAAFTGADTSKRDLVYQLNNSILPEFGNLRIVDIQAKQIRDWMQKLAKRPRRLRSKRGEPPLYDYKNFDADAKRRRRGTVNRTLTILKAALNQAFRDGKAPSDDEWRRVKPFPKTIVKKGTYLTAEQCKELVRNVAPDFKKFVQAALLTGARFSELRDLTKSSFDAKAGTLYIHKGKYGKNRNIVLTDEGIEFFNNLSVDLAADDRLLLRIDGQPWHPTDPYSRLSSGCQLAGISPRITFHQLRHTYASLGVMSGIHIAAIAKNLGHANSQACERFYAHLAPSYVSEQIREQMPRIGIL